MTTMRDYEIRRYPYNYAKRAYIAGNMLSSQAAAMAALDREFIAEEMTFIGYWRPYGGPIFLEGYWSPSNPLTWWARLPKPGKYPLRRARDLAGG